MTTRPRARWFALFAGALLIALSATSALGAGPSGDEEKNHGQQVSEFVHSLLFGDPASEDEDAPADESTDEDTEDTEDEEQAADEDSADEDSETGQPDNHGACVSAVAMDADAVGGENDNHGGAVSEAARVTCWEEETEEVEATDADAEDVHGKSADAHNKPHGHGRGHGGS